MDVDNIYLEDIEKQIVSTPESPAKTNLRARLRIAIFIVLAVLLFALVFVAGGVIYATTQAL